ncbi:MAG: serine hydrolase [Sphingomonas bacterium]|uniref:serine hydrolase domain-containing protein n=1 Tax=Sphingomonas bacterium TaxID=1895847 RepID=UPI00261DA406|nr:serine hydrolase domain-containing protein [Sphingomonas bacterium]MDB5706947.1 serine hydrolase [Sphingomonas bacterium]
MSFRGMISGAALIALIAGGALAVEARPQTQPQTATAQPSPLPATRALFDSYVAADKMPGIVGAFGVGDRPTVFVSAGRIADGPAAAAAGPDSLWRVYSMTKPITAMAAMILIEEGKIRLDQPVSDFIPAFRDMKVQLGPDTLETRPAARPITIRNLLTHTAGLGYNIITKGPLLKEYERLGLNPAAVNAQLEAQARLTRPATLEEFANRVAQAPLIADPGTKWSYSIGLDVMGRVIEVASGMSFDGFVQKRIFDPLRMTSSYWTVPQSEVGRFATNYLFLGDKRVPLDPAATSVWLSPPSFPYGGAGLVMSARDYDRFLHALQDGGTLDGVRVMKPATAALMMSNLLPPGADFTGAAATTGGTTAGTKMGFGAGGSVFLEDKPGGPSKGTYGWGGAAGTVAWVDPGRHVRGVIMVNYFPGEKWPMREEALNALLADAARYK